MDEHNNAADALRQADLAKIPAFSGHKSSDFFNAEMWIDRIQRAKDASNWDNGRTMCYVQNALRGEALLWWYSLPRTRISQTVWDDFKKGFLNSFSTARTARSTTINLHNLVQGQNERITAFYPRVIKAIDDLEFLLTGIPTMDDPWTAVTRGVAQFMGLDVADRAAQVVRIMKGGQTRAFNHMALTLFISNLRPSLRDEMLKNPPADLPSAFDKALEIEMIQADNAHKVTQPMMPVTAAAAPAPDAPVDEAEIESQIAALQTKLRRFNNKPAAARPNTYNNGNATGNSNFGNGNNKWRIPPNPAAKGKKCRYCHKLNHFQKDCMSRKRANAPEVGPDGRPYTRRDNAAVSMDQPPPSAQVVYDNATIPMNYMTMPPGYPMGYPADNPDFQ